MINRSTVNRISQILPFLEPVTLYSRQADADGVAEDTYTAYPLAKARVMEGRAAKFLASSPELLAKTEKVFETYANVLLSVNAPPPKVNDYFTDAAGQGWVVFDIIDDMNGTVSRCLCTKRQI